MPQYVPGGIYSQKAHVAQTKILEANAFTSQRMEASILFKIEEINGLPLSSKPPGQTFTLLYGLLTDALRRIYCILSVVTQRHAVLILLLRLFTLTSVSLDTISSSWVWAPLCYQTIQHHRLLFILSAAALESALSPRSPASTRSWYLKTKNWVSKISSSYK